MESVRPCGDHLVEQEQVSLAGTCPMVCTRVTHHHLWPATPTAPQTNLMVLGAGGYRNLDFVKFGGPMQLFMLVATSVILVSLNRCQGTCTSLRVQPQSLDS